MMRMLKIHPKIDFGAGFQLTKITCKVKNVFGVSIAILRKESAKDQQFACEVEPPMIADCHLLGEVVTPIKPTINHPRNLVLRTAKLPLEHQVGSDDR